MLCFCLWDILDKALQSCTEAATLGSVLELFEGMLCFDAWLNQDTVLETRRHRCGQIHPFVFSLRKLMSWCTTRIPTRERNGVTKWNFPKFHELLHIVDDMIRFGATTNFCAQRPESLLITAAKKPGRRAPRTTRGIQV